VLFVIDLESRRVHIAGVVRQPHGAWIQQVARNLVDNVDGFHRSDRDRHRAGRIARLACAQLARTRRSVKPRMRGSHGDSPGIHVRAVIKVQSCACASWSG
jgi:hypothetical protein